MNKEALTEGAVLTALEELGAMQWGLVTTGQSKRIGIERLWLSRLMDRGIVHRIRHGVYALPSATHGPYQELQAAWLITDRTRTLEERVMGDNDIVVSHTSAANVHGLGDLMATAHEFSSPQRRQTAQQDVHFYRRKLPAKDSVLENGLPVTSVPRTIADLADLHIDFDHLAQVVKDALSKGRADFGILASHLDSSAKTYGYDDGNEFMDALIEEAGLPATAESLLARNLSSALDLSLSQIFKDLESPKYLENLREGFKPVMPTPNAVSEMPEWLSRVVKSQLPNIDLTNWVKQLDFSPWIKGPPFGLNPLREIERSQSPRLQKPGQRASVRESEQRTEEDHEADKS